MGLCGDGFGGLVGVLDAGETEFDGGASDVVEGDCDARERGANDGADACAVETDDAEVGWDGDGEFGGGAHDAECDFVVSGEDACGFSCSVWEVCGAPFVAPVGGEVAELDLIGPWCGFGVEECLGEGVGACLGVEVGGGSGDVEAVLGLDGLEEVEGGLAGAGLVVDSDAVDAWDGFLGVDEDGGHVEIDDGLGELSVGEGKEGDDAVEEVEREALDGVVGAESRVAGDDDVVAVFTGGAVCALEEECVELAEEVWDDDAEDSACA